MLNKSARTWVGIILPALTILAFLVLLSFSLARLSSIERGMRIGATPNMLWVISQARVSSLELSDALAKFMSGEIDRQALELRHNVFLSRLNLLGEGPQRRQMEVLGLDGVLDEFREALSGLRPRMDALVAGDLEQMRAIHAQLEPYNHMLGSAANKAMIAEWDGLGSQLDTSREQLWQIIISLIAIFVAGVVICIHFLLAIRNARRRARLLNEEKAFSQLLIGSSGEGIVAVDRECRCTVWNEAAERLFKQRAARMIGVGLRETCGFFQVGPVEQAIDEALAGRPAAVLDQPFLHAGRTEPLYVDLRCFSLRDGAQLLGAILLVTDVTERRAAQREIANHRDHLEQVVKARTQALEAALEREQAAADLYRNFGAMISHQFRTPLAVVDSSLQRLMRRSAYLAPEEILMRGNKARSAIARLTRLVDSTLDAARLDSGQIDVYSEACHMREVVEQVCARQREWAPSRRIDTSFSPDAADVVAYCDPSHVEQILVNLLSNAIKYSPGDSRVQVELSQSGETVECAVHNVYVPGAGMLDGGTVFQRYFRGRNAEGQPGVGIGLYMARTLARMQGGDVRMSSSHPERVTFTLALPRAEPEKASGLLPAESGARA